MRTIAVFLLLCGVLGGTSQRGFAEEDFSASDFSEEFQDAVDLLNIDAADLKTLPVKEVLRGFHGYDLDFPFLGKKCRIHFFVHRQVRKKKLIPILLIHGFSDAGNSFTPFVRYLAKQGVSKQRLMWVDWPHHGRSDCSQASSFLQATQAVDEAMRLLVSEKGWKAPDVIIGHSMGTTLSAYLKKRFSAARLVWLSPPVLEPEFMRPLVTQVLSFDTPEEGWKWIELTGNDPLPHLPFRTLPPLKQVNGIFRWVAGRAMARRIQRARSVMEDFLDHPQTLQIAVDLMSAVPPHEVSIFVGTRDRLTPWTEAHETMKKTFGAQVHELECGHNIHRDCYRETIDQLVAERLFQAARTSLKD